MFARHMHLSEATFRFATMGRAVLPRVALLFVFCAAPIFARMAIAAGPSNGNATPILLLGPADDSEFLMAGRSQKSLLCRELVRQSLLLSAREELGWDTEDAWLGGKVGDRKLIHLDLAIVAGGINRIDVLAGGKEKRKLDSISLPMAVKDEESLLAACEVLSREQFPRILKTAAGTDAPDTAPAQKPSAAPLSPDLEQRIETIEFCSQFGAAQAIHRQIAASGESPELLGGLIRAYANLDMLSEGLWNPSFRVYASRALLYAQRWHVREPESPLALWHLAYAEGICGLHALAIRNLDAAEKLASPPGGVRQVARPSWVPLIRAAVFYDSKGLRAALDSPQNGQLASLLLVLLYDQSGSPALTIQVADKALKKMPECYRLYDEPSERYGMALIDALTSQSGDVFASHVYHEVASIHDLPAAAVAIVAARADSTTPLSTDDAVQEQSEREKLITALREGAAKPPDGAAHQELGWGALAQWIDDTTLSQIIARCEFLTDIMDSRPDKYIDSVWPLVKQHRYRAVVRAFRADKAEKKAGIEALKKLNLHGLDLRAETISHLVKWLDIAKANVQAEQLLAVKDNTLNDCRFICHTYDVNIPDKYLEAMSSISPHNPLSIAILIQRHWDQVKNHADEYGELAHEYPRVAWSLTYAYRKSKQFSQAEDFGKWAIALDPSLDSFMQLALVYLKEEKLDRFLQTCQECLRVTPDFGLQHAAIEDFAAAAYLRRGRWKQAEPFAQQAAASGASWAELRLAFVDEKLGKFDEADSLFEQDINAYGTDDAWQWYWFCLRTGHGNLEKARAAARGEQRKMLKGAKENHLYESAASDIMEKHETRAAKIFQWQFEHLDGLPEGLAAAMLADRAGDTSRRDKLLEEVKERAKRDSKKGKPASKSPARVGEFLANDLKNGGHADFTLSEAEEICKRECGQYLSPNAYIMGEYLAKHGKIEDAERFWIRAMDNADPVVVWIDLAGWRLKQAGVKPEEQDELRKKLGITDRWYTE